MTRHPMNATLWRSLRTRIVLLAIITCAFLAVAAVSFNSFIRGSYTAQVRQAEQHLSGVASGFARAYSDQAAHGVSLRNVAPGSEPHGPPPPPGPNGQVPVPRPWLIDPLAQITASVLQKEEGIEGGFLAGNGPLVGYAFPTHEGPGPQKEMPQRERPTIDQLAHQAETLGTAEHSSFEGPHDVVLFIAQPVTELVAGRQTITGAVWLMQRLPDLNRGRSKEFLLASLGFGAAALVTALLAWFVTVEISGGVNAVTRRLALLEQDLSQVSQTEERPQLAEFERVLAGVDAMAVSLQRRIANERSLEDQLRHKERLSSLGQFAAGVAHELRNPLATIRLRAQMSQQAASEGVVARNSNVILEEVDRLDTMISRLLYFSRPVSLDLQRLDISELCSSVISSWRDRAPLGVTLTSRTEKGIEIVADRGRLLQVFDNILENAIQACKATSGGVIIEIARHAGTVQIDVIDSGSGLDEAALKHAFDPFFTTKASGTGLGLSIAFELVQAHGGELKVASRASGGAIVSIVLPQDPMKHEVTP